MVSVYRETSRKRIRLGRLDIVCPLHLPRHVAGKCKEAPARPGGEPLIDLKARTGVRAIRIPGPFVNLRSNDVPQRLWKAPMQSSTLLAARVCALAVLAMALAAAPSHAGDDIRAGPTRTAKERLGGKASDEQRVDNCKVPPNLRGPKPRPERCGDGTGEKR